jgi:Dolichyl-phosphate-mannose-protein mannosyltransferase
MVEDGYVDAWLGGACAPMGNAARWRAMAPLAGVTACLLLAIAIVNPFRELLSADDGWAYARSVQHLVSTGEYRLDAWSAANSPVQIYLAAALSKIFGYSVSLTRLATLGMLAVGLASFYGLAREFRAARWASFAATLALLASPLVLLLSFTFNTDVTFMGFMLAALFLYVRGVRRGSDALVFLGSIAAAGAIGTRQFGLALVGGLLASWILCRRDDRPRLRTMALAAGLPTLAAGWQVLLGLQKPNFTQMVRLYEQRTYLDAPPAALAHELWWRAAMALQYIGISLLPALPLLLVAAVALARQSRRSATRLLLAATLIGSGLCATLLTGSPLTAPPDGPPRRLWPPLGMEWLLQHQLRDLPGLVRPIDLAGLGAAAALGAVALLSSPRLRPIRRNRPETVMVAGTLVCLLGLHLVYVQFNDTYIVPFVPFALLLLAVQYRDSIPVSRSLAAVAPAVALVAILLVSLWIWADFSVGNKLCAAADRLTAAGVAPAEIYGARHWMEYHGAFDDWLAAGHPGYELRPSLRPGFDTFHDPFYAWLETRGERAAYRVQDYPMSAPGWRLIARDSIPFHRGAVYTYQSR